MKISVVGAGHVGATCVQHLAQKQLANEVVVVDVVEGMPQGKGLDLYQAAPIVGYDTRVIGANSYEETAGSELVIITAGLARKPGMSRDDLQQKNSQIVASVVKEVVEYSPQTKIIVVSNPLDVMTYVALKVSGFEPHRVFGMAGILDTARYRAFLAMELNVSVRDIQAMVLGGHGDDMVPLPRYTTIAGIPLPNLLDKARIDAIVDRTRKGGAEIVGLLKTGSAYYAPGAAAVEMAEAVVLNSRRVLPCSAWLTGQYGLNDVYVGVPTVLSDRGIDRVLEIPLTDEEMAALHESAQHVKDSITKLNI